MGFGQGLSGLNAAAQNLDVIGNNIANSGTVGFKASTATFADVYANSRVGIGTSVASINQRFTIGTVAGTGNQFDMAIDGAKGLFRLQDPSGNVLYSRNGQFFADKDNNIVNAQGHRLTGYAQGGTNLVPIQVPVGNIPPQSTNTLGTKANFDANAKPVHLTDVAEVMGVVQLTPAGGGAPDLYTYSLDSDGALTWANQPGPGGYTDSNGNAVAIEADGTPSTTHFSTTGTGEAAYVAAATAVPFNPGNPASYTHSLPINVYDSLGNSHELMQYYVKRPDQSGSSQWDVYYRLDGNALNEPTGSVQRMVFDPSGRLESPTGPVTLRFDAPGAGGSPADPMNISLSYAGSTQYGGAFSSNFVQNGYPTGEYASMSIASDGSIVARYTNGQTQAMGTLALADFNNLQGLQPMGGNAWTETSASGQPVLGRPGQNGMATIKGQAVEESNVDMSQELVNMIIAQRTYQANAQTIKTQDQILQTLITMR